MVAAGQPVLMGERSFARRARRTATQPPPPHATVIQALRIGELGVASAPGELFVELGLAIKQRSPFGVQEAAALGAEAIWLEETMTDMSGPAQYRRFVFPVVRRMTEAIHAAGMRAVNYYCGDPAGKWDMRLDAGTDALALEEGRKGFENRIEDVVA